MSVFGLFARLVISALITFSFLFIIGLVSAYYFLLPDRFDAVANMLATEPVMSTLAAIWYDRAAWMVAVAVLAGMHVYTLVVFAMVYVFAEQTDRNTLPTMSSHPAAW